MSRDGQPGQDALAAMVASLRDADPAEPAHLDDLARRMNRELRADPERHRAVRDAIRAAGLDEVFPYALLNEGLARDLAVLYAWAPYADTSALVSARRIRERGVVVDVVSQQLAGMRETDPSAEVIAREHVARHHEVPGEPGDFDWEPIRRFCARGTEAVDAWVADGGAYRTVYSRAMWPASHVLAALVVARWPETRWIAEFSDPQQWNSYGSRREKVADDDELWDELSTILRRAGATPPADRNVGHTVELLAYATADEVVFTNERQKEFMLSYLQDRHLVPRIEERAEVSPHPTLPREFYSRVETTHAPRPGRLHIGYFGAFYPTRSLREVLAALRLLEPAEREQLRLHVFTPKPRRIRVQLREQETPRLPVRVRRAVDYLESLRLATSMDVLVVNDASTVDSYPCNPYLPSKWSDYRGSGRDIWALVEEGSVLSGMDVAYRSEIGDVAGALEQLRRMLHDHAARSPAAYPGRG